MALGALLAAQSALAREVPQAPQALDAISADDACAAGGCAVSALQISSKEAPRKSWVWDEKQIWKAWRNPVGTMIMRDGPVGNFWMNIIAPRNANWGCPKWMAYWWPKVDFWGREVLRRVEAVPEDAPPAQREALQRFVRNASWFMCSETLDPRNGTEFSEHVARYYRVVAEAPASLLDLPKLDAVDPWLLDSEAKRAIYAEDQCMYWAGSLACDLGHLARKLKGARQADKDLCWDNVNIPDYGFFDLDKKFYSESKRKPHMWEPEDMVHNEYLACQEHPLSEDVLESICPMAGHYPDHFWNVPSWGKGPPEGSKLYNDILQCQDKIGIPEWPLIRLPHVFDSAMMGLALERSLTAKDAP